MFLSFQRERQTPRFAARTRRVLVMVGFFCASGLLTGLFTPADAYGTPDSKALPFTAPPGPSLFQSTLFRTALLAGTVDGVSLNDPVTMERFYSARHDKPLWTDRAETMAVLDVLADGWTHGLNTTSYHIDRLRQETTGTFQIDNAVLELLLSDAVIRYGRDVTGMRVDPKSIRQKEKYWRQPFDSDDLLRNIAESDNPAAFLKSLTPQNALYDQMRGTLIRLTEKENRQGGAARPLDFGTPYLYPGSRAAQIPALRERLEASYDPQTGPAILYDDSLASAVTQFQKAHNLEPDGVIGPQTLALLNRDTAEQKAQIIANMERMRWLDQNFPEKYIMINIPSQRLWGVEKGKVSLDMPVVVGMTSRPTKSFRAEVTGVRFNPTWTVPLNLKMQDFLPRLRENPDYLSGKGIELIQGYGKNAITLDPRSIDWDNIGWRDMGKLRMVQTPGPHNALGRVRILMQNEYDIYMHDTNHPEYFTRTQRTYSSGCVRLSRPEDVARFVLDS
ncbi:MAG: L,D-transpeptidase family protein, partial [Alphaproteobacteria bacterium]|nr:L,D-transpeptidase family protein [Alphaproteobacteria bacterium]